MFLYFGSEKPERCDRSRQNYNYLVTACYCCLHYNSGNRFPDFPIGLNWGGVHRTRQQCHAGSSQVCNANGLIGADLADPPAVCRMRTPDSTRESGYYGPYDARTCGEGLSGAYFGIRSVIIDEE
jgi:hypothetical protein